MDEKDGTTRTLYPYEQRRRGRWRFGPLIALMTVSLMIVPMATQAAQQTGPSGPLPSHLPLGLQEPPGEACQYLGSYTTTLNGIHTWTWPEAVALSVDGEIAQTISLKHCQYGIPCQGADGTPQVVGYYLTTMTGLVLSDRVSDLHPVQFTPPTRWTYTCEDNDTVNAQANKYARSFQNYEGCAEGTIGTYRAAGALTIEAERPLWPVSGLYVHKVDLEPFAACSWDLPLAPAKMTGYGPMVDPQ